MRWGGSEEEPLLGMEASAGPGSVVMPSWIPVALSPSYAKWNTGKLGRVARKGQVLPWTVWPGSPFLLLPVPKAVPLRVGWPCLATNLGEPPVDSVATLQVGEVMVVERDICHDGALIWLWACHILRVQQLRDA